MSEITQKKTASGKFYTASDGFAIRTMARDIGRLRQGLPLEDTERLTGEGTQQTPVRRFATEVRAHVPEEASPGMPAGGHPPTVSAEAAPRPATLPRPAELRPPTPHAEARPIEAMSVAARPTIPRLPRAGRIETENVRDAPEEKVSLPEKIVGKIFSSKKRLAGAAAAVCIALGAGIYVLAVYFGKPLPGTRYIFPSPSATPTPAPTAKSTPSVTPTPPPTPTPSQPSARTSYLPISRLAIISLPEDPSAAELLRRLESIASVEDAPGDFKQVVVRRGTSSSPLTSQEFFELLDIAPPAAVLENISKDMTLFFYTHRDVVPGDKLRQGGTRFGIVIPVTGSEEKLAEGLRDWEATLGGDFAVFAFEKPWQAGNEPYFHDNAYQGVAMRYQNFPDPYLSVDHAVYKGSAPPLLIFTTSRESIFTIIGTLNYKN